MSENKQTVEIYLEGFRRGDHAMILGCLTDDVEWIMPGAFHWHGKTEFDGEIENPECFVGQPEIDCLRLVEENDVVICEGEVRSTLVGGAPFKAVFCDVMEMRSGKIKKLTSYLMVVKEQENSTEA